MSENNRNNYPGGEVAALPSPIPISGGGGDSGVELPTISEQSVTNQQEIIKQLKIMNRHLSDITGMTYNEDSIDE
jgi:hypothetical protein